MAAGTLALSALLGVVSGATFCFLGTRLHRRTVSPAAAAAKTAFSLWWFGLGAGSFITGAAVALYLAGALPVWLYQTYIQAQIAILVGALACLLYYLVFLHSGSPRSWVLPAAYAAVAYLAIEALIFLAAPLTGVGDNGWRLTRMPESSLDPRLGIVFLLVFIGPQIAAAVGYGLLWRRAADRTARYRIAMVCGTIVVWFSSSLVASLAGAADLVAWQVASQVLSLAAALAILAAYLPPRPWRRRWGLRSITEQA